MRLTQIHRFPERLLSTVHRGTAFEKRALALLTEHMSMSLTRVGGSYDGGIDLIGWWWVPGENSATFFHSSDPLDVAANPRDRSTANRRRLRVLAQCKAEKRKMGPAYLRELEGVVYKHAAGAVPDPPRRAPQTPSPPKDPPRPPATEAPSVALLVSESAFTRNCLLAAHASPLPFLLVHIPPSGPGALGAVYGNPALVSARGVLRGELEIRWEHAAGRGAPPAPPVDDGASAGLGGRPGLWWQGQPLPSWTPDADAPQSKL